MTFTEIVDEIKERLDMTSSDATTRIGKLVNKYNRLLTAEMGLQPSRNVLAVEADTVDGSAEVVFTGMEKVKRVYDDTSGTRRFLTVKTLDELRDKNPVTGTPTEWALLSTTATSVTILLNANAQDVYTLKCDGYGTASTLSGSQTPAFPESFHPILVEGVLKDEYRKIGRRDDAKDSKAEYIELSSKLKMWHAKSGYLKNRQGLHATNGSSGTSGMSGGSGGATSGGESYIQTGLITFQRASDPPFAVEDGSEYVANLYAEGVGNLATDHLVGRDTAGTGESEQIGVTGGIEFDGAGNIRTTAFTGDVTKTAGGTAQTIANDAVTYAKMQNVSAASKLLGRGSAGGSGDVEELTVGTGLSISGTTLSATSAPEDENTVVAAQVFN